MNVSPNDICVGVTMVFCIASTLLGQLRIEAAFISRFASVLIIVVSILKHSFQRSTARADLGIRFVLGIYTSGALMNMMTRRPAAFASAIVANCSGVIGSSSWILINSGFSKAPIDCSSAVMRDDKLLAMIALQL